MMFTILILQAAAAAEPAPLPATDASGWAEGEFNLDVSDDDNDDTKDKDKHKDKHKDADAASLSERPAASYRQMKTTKKAKMDDDDTSPAGRRGDFEPVDVARTSKISGSKMGPKAAKSGAAFSIEASKLDDSDDEQLYAAVAKQIARRAKRAANGVPEAKGPPGHGSGPTGPTVKAEGGESDPSQVARAAAGAAAGAVLECKQRPESENEEGAVRTVVKCEVAMAQGRHEKVTRRPEPPQPQIATIDLTTAADGGGSSASGGGDGGRPAAQGRSKARGEVCSDPK